MFWQSHLVTGPVQEPSSSSDGHRRPRPPGPVRVEPFRQPLTVAKPGLWLQVMVCCRLGAASEPRQVVAAASRAQVLQ